MSIRQRRFNSLKSFALHTFATRRWFFPGMEWICVIHFKFHLNVQAQEKIPGGAWRLGKGGDTPVTIDSGRLLSRNDSLAAPPSAVCKFQP